MKDCFSDFVLVEILGELIHSVVVRKKEEIE